MKIGRVTVRHTCRRVLAALSFIVWSVASLPQPANAQSILVKGAFDATQVLRGAQRLELVLAQGDAVALAKVWAEADVAELARAARADALDPNHPALRNTRLQEVLYGRSPVQTTGSVPCDHGPQLLASLTREIEDAARLSTRQQISSQSRAIRTAFDRPNHWTPFLKQITTAEEVEQVWELAQQVAGSPEVAEEFVVRFYTRLETALSQQSDEVRAFLDDVPRDWHKQYPVYYSYPNSLKFGGAPDEPATLFDLARAQGLDPDPYSLYVLPFWKGPGPGGAGVDGGFDVAEYKVGDVYGGEEGLSALLKRTRELRVPVIVDIIPNHVSVAHPWMQALRAGDLSMADRFVTVPADWRKVSEEIINGRSYAVYKDSKGNVTKRWIIFPHDARDHILAVNAGGTQVNLYHTFYRSQVDVNHANPDVFDYFLDVEASLINRGVLGIRVDAAQHIMKADGTTAEGLPETFALLELFNRFAKTLGRGRVKLFPEIGAGTSESIPYLGETVQFTGAGVSPKISDGFWGFQTRSRLPEVVVRRDAEPFWSFVDEIPQTMPRNSTIFAMDMHHDELPKEFLLEGDATMPTLLPRGYSFRDDGGVSGRMLPMVAGNENQIELMWALKTVGIPNSTPVMYYGEEAGLGNDLSHARLRQMQRESLLRSQGIEPGNAFDSRDVHRQIVDFADVRATETGYRPSQTYRDLLKLRFEYPSLRSDVPPTRLSVDDRQVIAMIRQTADGSDTPKLVMANLSSEAKTIQLLPGELPEGTLDALMTNNGVTILQSGRPISVKLEPETFAVIDIQGGAR